jgi:hypothetical protein
MVKRTPSQLNDLSMIRSARRRAHFEGGGNLVQWRGGAAVTIPNKKREASRKACRKWSTE